MQSALDLAESGYKVHLVEKSPSIGGRMPMLDKTFPTNDCSMCILSPKLVECGRHHNIDVYSYSELADLKGNPGNFTATVRKIPRLVDAEKCVGCGKCEEECPVKVDDHFNQDLNKRKAIYKLYPQAFPNAYVIDADKCLRVKKPKACGKCLEVCPTNAIDHNMQAELQDIDVGAVILCPGYELVDPGIRGEYGYGLYSNVITSLQLERMLSASGPSGGHVQKSDGTVPDKVAFIQCVGSRDISNNRGYCSSVCCMHASKEAIIAKEHHNNLDLSIFCMDVRAFGKDYEKYYNRAKDEYGVKYVKCMISSVKELPDKRLRLRYKKDDRSMIEEDFDVVVLSLGLKPTNDSIELAKQLGLELNHYNFCKTKEYTAVETLRDGIYVSGVFSSPKDIPETVTEASAAAGECGAFLSSARNTEVVEREFPPEKDVVGDILRVGVFVCHCGINIGSVVDVPGVVDYVSKLPGVKYATDKLYACAQDTSTQIIEAIQEHNLNRVVVASCSPRTHEPLFQETLKEAGLNPNLFEMANIRDQCSWVHASKPEQATEKAKDLVAMAVEKVKRLEPIQGTEMEINRDVLVIGGGVSGMNSAINMAKQGYKVNIVEKENKLGGVANRINYGLKGEDVQSYLATLIKKINDNPLITVYTESEVDDTTGFVGSYTTKLTTGEEINHGVVIIATGANEYKPVEYLYGQNDRVMTVLELEEAINSGDNKVNNGQNYVFIQCVGSRDDERPYCSRICCTKSINAAIKVKENNPEANVYILYRDIRTYGFFEDNYKKAREKGVIFIRYNTDDKPVVKPSENGVTVTVTDHILKTSLDIKADVVGLAAAIVPPRETNNKLSQLFKVPLNQDNFFLEAHLKLRPVDFSADGVFMAGLAHGPKNLEENIAQAKAAAGRATTILSRDSIKLEGKCAAVDKRKCIACGTCEAVCPANAVSVDQEQKVAVVNEAICKGCGVCSSTCRCGAITVKGCTDDQLTAMVNAI
ncbi:MAG: FAD-dependent oxidoreductase [Clostridiales bacterium]|nr:FAD-dependent oxidoreductase [Clostridiales bacterium]MCF8021979.1 FAD-dependent oxidoreductase [Clostridiales bacterium]